MMRGEYWGGNCLKWQLGTLAEQSGSCDFMNDYNDCAGNNVRHDDKNVCSRGGGMRMVNDGIK